MRQSLTGGELAGLLIRVGKITCAQWISSGEIESGLIHLIQRISMIIGLRPTWMSKQNRNQYGTGSGVLFDRITDP